MKINRATHDILGNKLPEYRNINECDVEYKNMMIGTAWTHPSGNKGYGTDCILYKTCQKKRQHYKIKE